MRNLSYRKDNARVTTLGVESGESGQLAGESHSEKKAFLIELFGLIDPFYQ